MKKIIFLLLLSMNVFGQSKITNKQFVLGPGQYAGKKWGIQSLPDSFNINPAKKYPILVFFHGRGEVGSTQADLAKLMSQGPTPFISKIGGKFIYIALQDQYYSPTPEDIDYVIKNDPDFKGRINGVIYTGLSAGGQMVMESVTKTPELAAGVTAIIPMSSPGYIKGGLDIAKKSGVKVWAFCGFKDVVGNAYATQELVMYTGGKFTPEPVDHGPWQQLYDPNYGIYDWALKQIPAAIDVSPVIVSGVQIGTITINGKVYKIIE